jgi:phosphonate transport system permease protein
MDDKNDIKSEHNKVSPPKRWRRPPITLWLGIVIGLGFIVHGFSISNLTPERFAKAVGRLGDFIGQAIPPNFERLPQILEATLETFEMALVGTLIGAILSLPLAILAARNTSPNVMVYFFFRWLIAFLRSVPDLVWGLIFLVAVGLGPGTGILAIAVDVMGFCGRFFAEKIEELAPGPIESLRMTGAPPIGVIVGAIVPAAMPSMVATTLYSLEHSVRSAVVLGLVGAGGIGVELSTSMKLLQYDTAFTIILVVFAVVISVERISAAIRRKLI